MELREILKQHLKEASDILKDFSSNEKYLRSVEEAALIIIQSLNSGKKIISAGNGGSMCDAMHFAEELTGRFRDDRNPIPAISISDPSHITCVGNDYGFDQIFSRYLDAVGNEGDVFFGITTSGNSNNITRALVTAKRKGMRTVILTSDRPESDVRLKFNHLIDNTILTPRNKYADRTQELHIKIIHSLIDMIERKLGLKNKDN